jgi:hypothetical protein
MLMLLHGYYEPDFHVVTEIVSMHASTSVEILYAWLTRREALGERRKNRGLVE